MGPSADVLLWEKICNDIQSFKLTWKWRGAPVKTAILYIGSSMGYQLHHFSLTASRLCHWRLFLGDTVGARKLECDYPPSPNQRKIKTSLNPLRSIFQLYGAYCTRIPDTQGGVLDSHQDPCVSAPAACKWSRAAHPSHRQNSLKGDYSEIMQGLQEPDQRPSRLFRKSFDHGSSEIFQDEAKWLSCTQQAAPRDDGGWNRCPNSQRAQHSLINEDALDNIGTPNMIKVLPGLSHMGLSGLRVGRHGLTAPYCPGPFDPWTPEVDEGSFQELGALI